MSKRLAAEVRSLYLGELRNVAIDCSGVLDRDETIIGTPVFSDPTGELTITAASVNSVVIEVNRYLVAVGLAVQCKIERGAAPAGTYLVDVLIETNAGQSISGTISVECR